MNQELITWVVQYQDGRVIHEQEGIPYKDLDRNGVTSVGLYSLEHSTRVVALPVDGNPNWFYRRRTQMAVGQPKKVSYLLGFYPDFCIQFDPTQELVTNIPVDVEPQPWEAFVS